FRGFIRLRPGDILLLTDFLATDRTILEQVTVAKKRGVKIGFLLFDLVPLPNEVFRKNLDGLINMADFCSTISETVNQELLAYVSKFFPERKLSAFSFRL